MVTDPFTDLLFNALLGFTFLFMVAILLINPLAKKGKVNLKAEYIITLTWPDDQPDDIDLWVEDPLGNRVSYLQPDVGWLHLDRDDRGNLNDTIMVNGEPQIYPLNQEVVTLRGIVSGEYTVNAYYYRANTGRPVTAAVRVDRINPELTIVYGGEITLQRENDENTAVRFTVHDDGSVAGINQLQKAITPYNLDAMDIMERMETEAPF